MPKFRSKSVIVEAIKYTGKNCNEIYRWMNRDQSCFGDCFGECLYVNNSDGCFYVNIGSWVVAVDGDYVVRSESFMVKHYDIVEEWV
jgi:hypothetical protein